MDAQPSHHDGVENESENNCENVFAWVTVISAQNSVNRYGKIQCQDYAVIDSGSTHILGGFREDFDKVASAPIVVI